MVRTRSGATSSAAAKAKAAAAARAAALSTRTPSPVRQRATAKGRRGASTSGEEGDVSSGATAVVRRRSVTARRASGSSPRRSSRRAPHVDDSDGPLDTVWRSVHGVLYKPSLYLDLRKLPNLSKYRYSSVDQSLISRHVLSHYWTAFTSLFPMWMAPNLITLLGFCFVLANVILLLVYVPDLDGQEPSWIYFSFAAGIWLYSTFDNVDGKQARRTGSSSPLGELFDHGVDSLNCGFGSLLQIAAVGAGNSPAALLLYTFLTATPFYISTWEEFHTKTLHLGYVNGPTEGLLFACAVMVASGIYGPKVWHVRLAADNSSWLNYIGSTWDKFLAWAMADGVLATAYQSLFQTDPASFVQKWAYTEWDRMDLALAALTVTVFVSLLPDSVSRVYKTISDRRPAQSRRVASHDQAHTYTFGAALSQLLSLPLYLFGIWTWASAPASRLLADDGSSQVFVAFLLAITFVFGRMATKIILAHLLLSPFPTPTILFVPLLGGALLANLGSLLTSLAGAYAIYPLPGATDFQEWTTTFSKTWLTTFANTVEPVYIWVFAAFAVILYFHWAYNVVHVICQHLGIHCFSIPPVQVVDVVAVPVASGSRKKA